MVKTLQKKVVFTAMTAITLLLLIFIAGINVSNYIMLDKQSTRLLERVINDEGLITQNNREHNNFRKRPPENKDVAMAARYFTVVFDKNGNITHTRMERISSVTEEEATDMANKAFAKGEEEGRRENFKYAIKLIGPDGDKLVVFLENSINYSSIAFVLTISMFFGTVLWLLMLIFVIWISKKAIMPIAENMEKQKQFVTNAGHEIKTPLAIIMANTEALELYNGENKWSKNIKLQAMRLSELMKNLLTLAKADETGIDLQMSRFALDKLVKETAESFYALSQDRGVSFDVDIDEEIYVNANRESITQIVSILLDNAVKYTTDKIFVSLKQNGKSAVFEVGNTYNEEQKCEPEKMFERFYRGDKARTQKSGGFGIGLSAARAMAQANNTEITGEYREDLIVFKVKFLIVS